MANQHLTPERIKKARDYGIAWADQAADAEVDAWSTDETLGQAGEESCQEGLRLSGLIDDLEDLDDEAWRKLQVEASDAAAKRWSELARWHAALQKAEEAESEFEDQHGTLRAGLYENGSDYADSYTSASDWPADMPAEMEKRAKEQLAAAYDKARAEWIGSQNPEMLKAWYAAYADSAAPAPRNFAICDEEDIFRALFEGDRNEAEYSGMDLLGAIEAERHQPHNLPDGGGQYDSDLLASADAVRKIREGKTVYLAVDDDGVWFCGEA